MPGISATPSALSTSSPPSRLIIPALKIDTIVEHVGVTKAGLMGNPSNFVNVAWFKFGPAPGDEGSAVIGGHVDNALALDGVFKHLNTLKAGDMIEVKNEAGATLSFRVSAVETYPYQSVPQAIFTKTGGVYLNLITCAGTWQSKQHTYDQRLVIYTEFVGLAPGA
jgi:LPXTG-site transpeptidase (sortase) family protein